MGLKEQIENMRLNQIGQLSIGTVIMVIMTMIVFAVLTPTLNSFVNLASTTLIPGSAASTIVELWPFAIAISILWGVFIYAKPVYERYTG